MSPSSIKHHPIKHMGSGDIAPHILNLGTTEI